MSDVEIFEVEQGSEEWFRIRAGCITASMFSTVRDRLKSGPNKGGYKAAALDYAFRLAIERISGEPLNEGFEPWEARRGRELEPEARSLHAFEIGQDVEPTGVARTTDRRFAVSADGLIGEDGGAEYKCLLAPERLRSIIVDGKLDEFQDQVQGGMWLSGLAWWHLCFYCPYLKGTGKDLIIHEVKRDDDYIEAMESDLLEFDKLVESYRERLLDAA